MESKQVIWVFGDSGAGKETFINHVTGAKPAELLQRLGLSDSIGASQPSMDLLGLEFRDENTERRDEIFISVEEGLKAFDAMLIKGQIVDLEDERPQRLRKILPNAGHSIIYLEAGLEGAFERWKGKPWYTDSHHIRMARDQRDLHFQAMRGVTDFPLTVLNSLEGRKYSSLTFPDELRKVGFS